MPRAQRHLICSSSTGHPSGWGTLHLPPKSNPGAHPGAAGLSIHSGAQDLRGEGSLTSCCLSCSCFLQGGSRPSSSAAFPLGGSSFLAPQRIGGLEPPLSLGRKEELPLPTTPGRGKEEAGEKRGEGPLPRRGSLQAEVSGAAGPHPQPPACTLSPHLCVLRPILVTLR